MDNLKEKMKGKCHSYSKKEIISVWESAISIVGEERYLIIAMEELAELNEVIASNTLNKTDYVHTAEEINDATMMMELVKIICGVPDKKIKKPSKIKKHVLITSMRNISKAQQNISKYIRYHGSKDSYDKVVDALNLMADTIPALITLFKIRKKDINKIKDIKCARLESRIENGTLH